MDQKKYLKKYLSGEVGKANKKKKKKDKIVGKATVRIVDDDLDICKLADATEEELDNYTLGEDLPQIAGIIDERPPDVIAEESGKWKSIVKNESRFGPNLMHAHWSKQLNESSYRDKNSPSSDASPRNHSRKCIEVSPTHRLKKSSNWESKKIVNLSVKRNSGKDSDASPPRKTRRLNVSAARKLGNVAELSPKRKSERGSDASAPRRSKKDSDNSPDNSPNHSLRNNFELSPKRVTDGSPPCRSKETTEFSPKRRAKKSSSVSPRRYSCKSADVTLHRFKQNPDSRQLCGGFELKSKKSRWDTKETTSRNPNKTLHHNLSRKMSISGSPPRSANRNSDSSPPRRPKLSPENYKKNTERNFNTSGKGKSKHSPDTSPRRRRQKRDFSPRPPTSESDERQNQITKFYSPPPTHKKMIRTLEGKVAGLQDAMALRDEIEQFKKREEEMFKQMAEKYKDEDCRTARDRKTGGRRNVYENVEKEQEKLMKEDERKKTYSRWGAGLKQIEDFKDRVESETHEMSKPMARYADDKDLEDRLRNQYRDGDPMAEYIRKKHKENSSVPSVPVYQGAFPENRFNIRPGYRWDGVDRSNGYEIKWFDIQSKKKAVEEEAYKYSVEDM